jgi:glycosyltransferase involved in cell wall biosynthesis
MRIGIDASRAFVDQATGTERYSWEVIHRLVTLPEARSHEWVLYVKGNVREQFPENVQVVEIKLKYLWTQWGLAMRTWIDRLDVLWVPAHTLPVLKRWGLKSIVTIHGIEYEWLPAYENWLQRWYLPLSTIFAVRVATKIIAVSHFTAQQLVERLNADEKKIHVVHEGVSKKEEGGDGRVLTKWGLRKRGYVLFLGTVQPRKNLERLVDAYSKLNGGKELRLVIAGKLGWGYSGVMKKAQAISDRVITTGYINETERYTLLRYALVYVQPSITEGFGLPVLEAWQFGLPVVSSRGGALSEVVGHAGLLFDPLNVEEITNQLQRVMDDARLRNELIRLGKDRVNEFSWDKTAKETYNILISS